LTESVAGETAPSGLQLEIAFEEQRAVVVEVGGGLRSYSDGGRAILDGYEAEDIASAGRGQLLIPWPNRVADGAYEFDGRPHQLPLDEPERRNAVHGLVRWSPWTLAERSAERVLMEHLLRPRPGYPFTLMLAVEYTLSEDGLSVRTTATNVGSEPCPYGSGAHPYLLVEGGKVDDAVLRAPAGAVLQADERGLPVGRMPVEGTELDFREPRRIEAVALDHAFTDLERDSDGLARVELDYDGNGSELWVDESYPYLMLFTGEGIPGHERRSLAVEPMTCAPNAFRSGDGLVRLEQGQSHTGTWGMTRRR
jgi:aldose 1-epimerase